MTLVSLAAAWLVGVFLGFQLDAPVTAIALFLAASGLLLALSIITRRLRLLPVLCAILVLGMLRVDAASLWPSALAQYHSPLPLQVEGVVVDDPESAGTATRLRLRVDRIRQGDS